MSAGVAHQAHRSGDTDKSNNLRHHFGVGKLLVWAEVGRHVGLHEQREEVAADDGSLLDLARILGLDLAPLAPHKLDTVLLQLFGRVQDGATSGRDVKVGDPREEVVQNVKLCERLSLAEEVEDCLCEVVVRLSQRWTVRTVCRGDLTDTGTPHHGSHNQSRQDR